MKKRFLSLLLALALCLGLTVPAFADDVAAQMLGTDQYSFENGTLTVKEGVEQIGHHAFENRADIVRVVLPASVTYIGVSAFEGCSNLESLTAAGEGGLEVDSSAFIFCTRMVLNLGSRYLTKVGGNAFSQCKQVTSLDLSQVDYIPMSAFDGAGLTSVVLSEKANMIAPEAFYRCDNLVSVTVPASVLSIGENAFAVESLVPNAGGGYVSAKVPNPNLTIYGEAGSCAETYAQENGLKFVAGTAPAAPVQPAQPEAPAQPAAPAQPSALTASPTASTVTVNGAAMDFDAYNINGNNYFKLRDLALVLNGTEKQFSVDWDASANAISLTAGAPYVSVGGEMTPGTGAAQTPTPTSSKLLLDGAELSLEAYNINNNNYFKLRDIGAALHFGVDWDGANNTVVIDTTKEYTPD